jgi:hypothetical protein
LDELINHKDVLLKLKEEGFAVTHQKKKLRSGYLKLYWNAVPVTEPVTIDDPISKRQCTNLPPGFYTEKTSTDFFTTEEKARLKDFNKLWSFSTSKMIQEPISMDQAQHPKNVHLRRHMHWYCEQAMDILTPGHGQELYQHICTIEKQYANQTTQSTLNHVVDNLVELCLFAEYWEHKRLAFVQLCGALSMKELNIRLHNRIIRGKNQTTGGRDVSAGDTPCPAMIKRVKYLTGGIAA